MTLNEYLKLNRMTDGDFAYRIRRDRTTVSRWRTGKTRPDWNALKLIESATGGAVMPNDFRPLASTTEAAE